MRRKRRSLLQRPADHSGRLGAGHISLNAVAGQLNARKWSPGDRGVWRHVQVLDSGAGTPVDVGSKGRRIENVLATFLSLPRGGVCIVAR